MNVKRRPYHNKAAQWLAAVDNSILFDPSRWPQRELVSRCFACLVISGFLFIKLYQWDRFPQSFETVRIFYQSMGANNGNPLYSMGDIQMIWGIRLCVWMVETAIFLGYIASYFTRKEAVGIAKGLLETVFPFVVAGIPILISLTPYNLPERVPFISTRHFYFYTGIMVLILTGGLINLVGLLTLRRSFSIMSEAREVITTGIFSKVRHPLYTGHFIMFFGSLCLRLHAYTIVLYILFALGQVFRARVEEKKLIRFFPAYRAYQKKTGMFFPKIVS